MKVTDEMIITALKNKYGADLVPTQTMRDKMRDLLQPVLDMVHIQEPLSYEKVVELKDKCFIYTHDGAHILDYFMFATGLESGIGENEITAYKWLPSEPTTEMLEAVGSLSTLLSNCDTRYEAYETIYKAMWKAAPKVKQEPYAYATLWESGEWSVIQDINPNAVRQVPLYTRSQSEREPLSYAEIMQIVNENEGDTIGVVRALEKAHGIGA
jgi:hypothetical protein